MGLKRISLSYRRAVAASLGRFIARPWFVFLDSCRDGCSGGRYDLIACDPLATVVTVGDITTVTTASDSTAYADDPFAVLERTLASHLPPTGEAEFFTGGALGYFAYDLGRRVERLPARAARDIDMPEMAVGIYGWAIVVDHQTESAELLIHPQASCDEDKVLRAWEAQRPLTPAAFGSLFEVTSPAGPELSFEQYAASWRQIKRYLREGDVYQATPGTPTCVCAQSIPRRIRPIWRCRRARCSVLRPSASSGSMPAWSRPGRSRARCRAEPRRKKTVGSRLHWRKAPRIGRRT